MNASHKYIVTDPCYLIKREVWDKIGNETDWESPAFDRALEKELGESAVVSGTGFGDWDNELRGKGVVQNPFSADSGMVAFIPVEGYTECIGNPSIAIIESDRPLRCHIGGKDWKILRIFNEDFYQIAESLDCDQGEEDDDGDTD
jgi:hypothetical protein